MTRTIKSNPYVTMSYNIDQDNGEILPFFLNTRIKVTKTTIISEASRSENETYTIKLYNMKRMLLRVQ